MADSFSPLQAYRAEHGKTQSELAQSYVMDYVNTISKYNNKRAGEWIQSANWLYANANDIYNDTDIDPREKASAKLFVDGVRESLPGLSEEYLYSNYKKIIKQATGNDLDATGLFDVFGQKVANGYRSFAAGVSAIGFEIENLFSDNKSDDYEDEQRKKRQDKFLSSIAGNVRTDYYNEYDNFVERAILGLGDTLPSLLNSTPAMIGAVASGATGNPLFYGAGKTIADALNFTMEFGSLVQTLRETKATPEEILTAAGLYATISTAIEHNFDKIPENMLAKPIGQWMRLYKDVGGIGTAGIADSIRKVFAKRALTAGVNWVSETGEEMFQQAAEDWTVNLLDKYRKQTGKDGLPDWITATPEKMVADIINTGKEMGTTQTLISVAEAILGLGFDASFGNIKYLSSANKYQNKAKGASFIRNNEIVTDNKTKPSTVKDGKVDTVKFYDINGKFVPVNAEEMAKAKYMKGNSKYGMYGEVVKSDVTGKSISADEARSVANGLIDENNGHRVLYSINSDGSIVVDNADINDVVTDFVNTHIGEVQNVISTEEGVDVVYDGKKVSFTVDERRNAEQFSQDEHMHNLMRKIAEGRDERQAQEAQEQLDREINLSNRYNESTAQKQNIKTFAFNRAVNNIVNKLFSSKQDRAAEISKYKAEEARLSSVIGNVVDEALKDEKVRGILRSVNRDRIVKSFTRASVITEGKLAQSMGKSIADFAGKIKFEFNPESMQEGMERMGWTSANADGTYTISLTRLADQSTAIHELGHAYLYMLGKDGYKSIDGFEKAFADALKKDGGKIGDATHEAFAEALENYVNQGVAADSGLRAVFNNILDALRNFIDAVRDVISADQIKMFDTLFEKGLKEGWKESDDINEGRQFKTASSYYFDNQLSRNNRTEEGNKKDRAITEGFISTLNRTYGDAVDIKYDNSGILELNFSSDDAEIDFLYFMRNTESAMLAQEGNSNKGDDYIRFALFLPHGNVQLIDVKSDSNDNDIFVSLNDTVKGQRNSLYKQLYEDAEGDEKLASLVDLFDMYADDETKNYTNASHVSPNLFDAFRVIKSREGETLGKKYGYGIYNFDNLQAALGVLWDISRSSDSDKYYSYRTRVFTGNEDKFIHASSNDDYDAQVSGTQIDMLDDYSKRVHRISLERLARDFVESDIEDYVNVNGATYSDFVEMLRDEYGGFSEDVAQDMVSIVNDACLSVIKGEPVGGTAFFYMTQLLFGKNNLLWDAREAFLGAGFKGMIVYEDYWVGATRAVDTDNAVVQQPTEIIVFDPSDIEIVNRDSITREEVEAENEFADMFGLPGYNLDGTGTKVHDSLAEEANDKLMSEQKKYKTVWTSDKVKERLEAGAFVPTNVLNQYKSDDAVKIERIAQNIIAAHEDLYESAKKAIDEYSYGANKTVSEFTDTDWEEVIALWKKNAKVESENVLKDIPANSDTVLLLKRLNAYATDESPERTTSQWIAKYTNVKNGRKNMQDLAVEMQKAGLFNDKVTVDGESLSEKYTNLNYIYNKIQKAEERKNKRVYIDSIIYEEALKEILNNSDSIMNELGLDTEFAKGDIMEEIDSNEDYTESRSVKALLDLELSDEVKDVIQDARWNHTIARNLAKKYNQAIAERNLQNTTIQELRQRRDQLKNELANLREEKDFYKREAAYKMRLVANINRLTEDIITLSSAYAAKKMESELYKTRKQLTETINAKAGDAVLKRLIKEATRAVMSYDSNSADKGIEVFIDNDTLGKLTHIKSFLEANDFIKDGKLVKGLNDMTISEMNEFKKAVKQDKRIARETEKNNKDAFNAKVQNDANRVISTLGNSSLAKLTKENSDEVRAEEERLTAGRTDISRQERREIRQQARANVLAAKMESIMRDARYGTEEHTNKTRRRGSIGDDFTTFSRILRNVSPELYKIVMEDGLNVVTDNKYKWFDKRYGQFLQNMKRITGIDSDKKLRKSLKNLMSLKSKLDVIGDKAINKRLSNNAYFSQLLEEDENIRNERSDTEYTLQEMMAIYEHSFTDGGLKHLHDGNHISAYEIAWVVDKFENGDYKQYKPVADEIRRVMGERFPELYDTVLQNENREIQKVSLYSAQMNVDYDVDLGMQFSYSFGDEKVSQRNSFTKDRQFGANPISLNYYSDLRRIIEMQEAYINGASFFKEMDYLFDAKGGNLRNIITETYDKRTSDRILQMLDICKNDSVVSNRMTEADGWVSKVRNHYVLARLAFNLSSVFQQGASYFQGFSKYGVGRMWKATMQFMMHPIQMCNQVYALSPQMRHAVNPLLAMAEDTMSRNPDSVAGKVNDALASIGSKGLFLMEKYDHIVRNTLWWVSYQAELDALSGNGKKELSTDDLDLAQRRATQWVLDIQSSSQAKDNALIYAKGEAIWKNLLMFTNQMNKEWNMLWNDAIKNGLLKGEVGKFFANFFALSLATTWVVLSTGKLKNNEDDDETWIEDLLGDYATEFVSRVPVLGTTAKNALEGFTYEQTDDPVTRTIELIKKLSSGDEKKTKTAIKNEIWSVLDIFGAPTTAIKRGYRTFEGGDFLQMDHLMRQLGGEWYKYFE